MFFKYKKMNTWTALSKKSPFGNSLPAVSKSLTYPRSLAIELTIFGNWIFTATGSSRPVGDIPAAKTAVWTWPIEAAAKGILSKFTKSSDQEEPKELVKTCWEILESVVEIYWQAMKNVLPFANPACNARYPALYGIFYRSLQVKHAYLRDARIRIEKNK